jgi:hypothetical protein
MTDPRYDDPPEYEPDDGAGEAQRLAEVADAAAAELAEIEDWDRDD